MQHPTNKTHLRREVIWRDLYAYQPWETVKEVLLPVPWLITAFWASTQAYYLVTIIASFYFFLTGLRVTHNAFHSCLGLPRIYNDSVMTILSVLMLGSLHAIQTTHLLHHRYCMTDKDVEGAVAKQGLWMTLFKGPLFPYVLHREGWLASNHKQRRWIALELLLTIIWLASIWLLLDSDVLKIHSLLMLSAYCLSAFFAVWIVHHDCDHDSWDHSRTIRSKWKSLLVFNMFYHIEHHLFPQVPTCHLPELAKRLDNAGYTTHKAVI